MRESSFSWYKFLGFSAVILCLPIILTQSSFIIFDFTRSGQVGDTIGGITAPFVGLLSAYLIYKAFLVQIDANKIQSKNNEFGIALKLIDDLEKRFNDENNPYEYTYGDNQVIKSEKARFFEIVRFWNGMKAYRVHYTQMIVLTIRQVNYFRRYVEGSTTLTAKDKSLLFEKASLTFGHSLHDSFETLLMTETNDVSDSDQQFYAFCRRFFDTTVELLLFHQININEFND